MKKKNELTVFVPSEAVVNVRESTTVEEALGIEFSRFDELGVIMNEIWENKPTKAEALLAIANRQDLTDLEKTYMGYKLLERICQRVIPMWGFLSRGI